MLLRILLCVTLLSSLGTFRSFSSDETFSKESKEDFNKFLKVAGKSSYNQLFMSETLITLGVGAMFVTKVHQYDDRGVEVFSNSKMANYKVTKIIGNDLGALSTISPLITYGIARQIENEKFRQFSIEFASSVLLVTMETIVISQYNWHGRPRDAGGERHQSFFEDTFRGRSSFPSGHVIAPFLLTFKTYEYYGFVPSLLPAAFSAATVSSRIGGMAHYPTDIVGTFFFALSGHLATQKIMAEENLKTQNQKKIAIYGAPFHGGAFVGMNIIY